MDVAVIGGTGAEGFGLAIRLAAAGHHVTIGSRDAERGAASAAEASELAGARRRRDRQPHRGGRRRGRRRRGRDRPVRGSGRASTARSRTPSPPARWCWTRPVPLATAVGGRPWQVLRPWHGSAAEQAQAILGDGARMVAGFHTVAAESLRALDHDDRQRRPPVRRRRGGEGARRRADRGDPRHAMGGCRPPRDGADRRAAHGACSSRSTGRYKIKDSGLPDRRPRRLGTSGDVALVDHGEDLAGLHHLAGVDRELRHLAVAGRRHVVLHLHRLEDADHVARRGPPGPSRRAPSRSCPASGRGSRRARARRGARRGATGGSWGGRSRARRRSGRGPGGRRPRRGCRPAGSRARRPAGRGPRWAGSSASRERALEPGRRVRARPELLRSPGSSGAPGSWSARPRPRTRRARGASADPRRLAVVAAHDQLGEHRVVVAGDLPALARRPSRPARTDPAGSRYRGDPARAREEVPARVLGVDAALDRRARAGSRIEVDLLAERHRGSGARPGRGRSPSR